MTNPRRPWDRVMPRYQVEEAMNNRLYPSGKQVQCDTKYVGGKKVNDYPWHKMSDGDYFLAKIIGTKESIFTTVRQTGARMDIEFVSKVVMIEGEDYVRVTRIQSGVNKYKDQIGVTRFNTTRRNKYQRKYRKDLRKRIRDEEEERKWLDNPPAPVDDAAGKEKHTNHNRDYKQQMDDRLREAREKAIRESAEMDEDDPDFMGLFDRGE